jgi:hypothetical protein
VNGNLILPSENLAQCCVDYGVDTTDNSDELDVNPDLIVFNENQAEEVKEVSDAPAQETGDTKVENNENTVSGEGADITADAPKEDVNTVIIEEPAIVPTDPVEAPKEEDKAIVNNENTGEVVNNPETNSDSSEPAPVPEPEQAVLAPEPAVISDTTPIN